MQLLLFFMVMALCCVLQECQRILLKFQSTDGIKDINSQSNSTYENSTMAREMEIMLRREASTIVVVIFLFITVGIYCCCTHLAEPMIDRCQIV